MKNVLGMIAAVLLFCAGSASAGEVRPYSQTEFDALAAQGRPTVIAVHAPSCPTCKVQATIQSGLMSSAAYKDFTMFIVDFDTAKPLLRKHKVTSQSTMIVYKGTTEVGRSVGDTSPEGIEALIRKAKA